MTKPSDDSNREKESRLPSIIGTGIMVLGAVTGLAPLILYCCSAAAKNKLEPMDYGASVVLGVVFCAIGLIVSKRETRETEESEQTKPIDIYPHPSLYSRIKDYLHLQKTD